MKTILIIEDDTPLRIALENKFTREGFSVLVAQDGEEGLNQALQKTPDVIILDLVMPKLNGWEVLKALRNFSEWGKAVPVIILSNLNPNDDKQMANVTALEPSYFLEKATWKIEDIIQKVKERLEEKP